MAEKSINGCKVLKDLGMYAVGNQGKRLRKYLVQCECGGVREVWACNFKQGHEKCNSCKSTKSGLHKTRLYQTYKDMIYRTSNPNKKAYANYGERGIRVCERWVGVNGLDRFVEDIREAFSDQLISGDIPKGLELDRKDNDGNYELANVRLVTPKTNARNRRSNVMYQGKCLSEWSEITGVHCNTIRYRRRKGWSLREAIFGKSTEAVIEKKS